MIEESYIQGKIDIIFQQEIDNLKAGIFFSYIDNSNPQMAYSDALFKHDDILKADSIKLSLMQGKPKTIKWDTFSTLKKLYNEIETNQNSRSTFIRIINNKLLGRRAFVNILDREYSSLGFYFLMKIGAIDEATQTLAKSFKKWTKNDSSILRHGLFLDIYIFMAMEPDYFDDDTLCLLKELNESCVYSASLHKCKTRFRLHVNNLRYTNLKNELRGINEELNIDKEIVISIISKYNFPPSMEDFLLQIDKIPESSEWDSINSGMIGNLRAFYEELIRNIAKSIKEKCGDEFPNNSDKGEMGNKRLYIKQHLELTDEDNKLITSYVGVLHEEGGHSFISEKKYYRLTKNIGIEIAYFLLSKLEVFLEK